MKNQRFHARVDEERITATLFLEKARLWYLNVSDDLDGYIARKTETASKLGEKLDSVADLIMVVVLTIVLYPIINPTVQIIV